MGVRGGDASTCGLLHWVHSGSNALSIRSKEWVFGLKRFKEELYVSDTNVFRESHNAFIAK